MSLIELFRFSASWWPAYWHWNLFGPHVERRQQQAPDANATP
uniref:Uncharacterized protein n=1 Tax=Anguilla anguilla TaxID=7936 RepID=A0A0E9QN49_ANGAN